MPQAQSSTFAIRDAVEADVDVIVAFTLQEALEAEHRQLEQHVVRFGVMAAFADPPVAHYWLAEDGAGAAVAAVSVVKEWSDFQAGEYWWVQSLYIVPECRGQGLVEILLDHLTGEARRHGALDLRLHVHETNERARRAYSRCGFEVAPYAIMTRPTK
jgi:ribosomal protein S18 acetylase RimI-like enzyme